MRQAHNAKHIIGSLLLAGLLLANAACSYPSIPALIQAAHIPIHVEQLVPKILSVRPHDTAAYTEGLVWSGGMLYESAGLYGQSSLRQVDPDTGKVLRRLDLPAQYFGEGLALAGHRLVQLTWHEQVAFIYDVGTFANLGTFAYTGEGWGLCFDDQAFFRDDGSSVISVHDAATFQVTRQIPVTLEGGPVANLNELECVGDSLYANVWHTNNIMRIDKKSGLVTAVIDASGLLTPRETAAAGAEGVLNGIAYDSEQDTFFITGKLWPWMFEVRFVPRQP
jgi:glutamine cyclotransferase